MTKAHDCCEEASDHIRYYENGDMWFIYLWKKTSFSTFSEGICINEHIKFCPYCGEELYSYAKEQAEKAYQGWHSDQNEKEAWESTTIKLLDELGIAYDANPSLRIAEKLNEVIKTLNKIQEKLKCQKT